MFQFTITAIVNIVNPRVTEISNNTDQFFTFSAKKNGFISSVESILFFKSYKIFRSDC